MKVTPFPKTTSTFVKESFLRIPRFQRPYDWENENLADFWNDLREEGNSDYFMGSVVLYHDGKENNVVYVVDGQQRLTTSVILLSSIRDKFIELSEDNLAVGVQNFLVTKDNDNKDRFVLEHTPANVFFQNLVMLKDGDKTKKPSSQEEKNILNARTQLTRLLNFEVDKLDNKDEKIALLKEVRDRILSHQYISVELGNEDDAYIIFETLNTRGKDLRISDLVKNHFARSIKGKAKSDDPVRERWASINQQFDSVKTAYSIDDFILHYWLSKEGFVSQKLLFKEFKKATNKRNALSRLKDLESDAEIYTQVVAPSDSRWSKEESGLRDSLAAVGVFRVAQAIPLMLSVMRLYRKKVIKLAAAAEALRMIEVFTFQFNAITQSRGGGGISAMYAKLAQSVSDTSDSQEFAKRLKEIRAKFAKRLPSSEEFDYPFATTIFRDDHKRYKDLVRYMLRKISKEKGMDAKYNADIMTIEHLQSQSRGAKTWEPDDVGAIGNLAFVTEDLNGKLDSKDFKEKKSLLLTVPWISSDLQDKTVWGKKQISQRGYKLAKLAREKVWKL